MIKIYTHLEKMLEKLGLKPFPSLLAQVKVLLGGGLKVLYQAGWYGGHQEDRH